MSEPLSQTRQGTRVLIVEDEAASRRAMESLFRMSGYRPIAVGSAEEALDLIEHDEIPQVALVDLDLPGMDGLSFIREMAAREPNMRSVLITATSRERLDAALKRHEVQYLRKPIDFSNVLKLLDADQNHN